MEATQTIQRLTRDEFLHHLAESGLLRAEEIERITTDHPKDDAMSLAAALGSSGTLTAFQLDAINRGNPNELKIGNYDVVDRLGAGGMGTVLKARHRRMKRTVALKILSGTLSKDHSFVQRFQREVETIARLQHCNIVMAFDADEAEIGHFLVMEFVDGRDLSSVVEKSGPLSVALAIDYTLQAARGLAYAHSQEIIHRDIKPANLLLDSSGVVKVTDLGLARLNPAAGVGSSATGITQAGGIVGTVDYMSPEQAVDSTDVDHRTDIYSLGCTLYFLLTGRAIFGGGNAMSVLVRHREAPIPWLLSVREDIPPELENIFRRMVAKKPDDRYSTMTHVVAALEPLAAKLPNTAAPIVAPPSPVSKSDSSIASNRPDQKTIVASPSAATGLSVLIVEPSRMQSRIVRGYLEAQQLAVAGVATTGSEAIAAVREKKPGVVIASLHLDDMSGVELAKKIRDEIKPNAPGFVLISSDTEDKDSASLSQINRTVLLSKPFTAMQLVQSINLVTGNSGGHASTDFSVAGLESPSADRSTLKVLLVDDSSVARATQRIALQKLGFTQIIEVSDGAQAIAATAREKFDLIVTDYNMPLMDGYALVSYLRQTPATASTPIIMVTTETDSKVLDPVRRLGVSAICDKSFPVDEVRNIVDQLF